GGDALIAPRRARPTAPSRSQIQPIRSARESEEGGGTGGRADSAAASSGSPSSSAGVARSNACTTARADPEPIGSVAALPGARALPARSLGTETMRAPEREREASRTQSVSPSVSGAPSAFSNSERR